MIIQKLLSLGWEPREYFDENDSDFYLRKEFEISKANELENFTNYVPKTNEKVFLAYEIYPNKQSALWCIWSESDYPGNVIWERDNYEEVVRLALEDRLFTYPENRKEG